jgi:hypothetical protein
MIRKAQSLNLRKHHAPRRREARPDGLEESLIVLARGERV